MFKYFTVSLGGALGYYRKSARGDLETVTFSAVITANTIS